MTWPTADKIHQGLFSNSTTSQPSSDMAASPGTVPRAPSKLCMFCSVPLEHVLHHCCQNVGHPRSVNTESAFCCQETKKIVLKKEDGCHSDPKCPPRPPILTPVVNARATSMRWVRRQRCLLALQILGAISQVRDCSLCCFLRARQTKDTVLVRAIVK